MTPNIFIRGLIFFEEILGNCNIRTKLCMIEIVLELFKFKEDGIYGVSDIQGESRNTFR